MADRKTYRILSLDGGGIRGLMTAVWLKQLEQKLGGPLTEHFDLVAGTSTGALLACAVSSGMSADRILQVYVERGREVFPSRAAQLWSRATRLFSDGVSAPKYDGVGLRQELVGVFGNATFGTLRIDPTLITSYDTQRRESIVFKTLHERHRSLRIVDICMASAAAPAYFPAHVVEIEGRTSPLIDGGVVANNPTACAIAEAAAVHKDDEKFSLKKLIVASFGTGEATRPITAAEAKEWGAVEWALPIVDVLFDGSADSVDYIARHILSDGNYFRFQTRLEDAYDDMDNADRTNLAALQRIATDYISSSPGKDVLKGLVKRLQAAD